MPHHIFQVSLVATLVLAVSTTDQSSTKLSRSRPSHIAGYPVERDYRVQEKDGPEESDDQQLTLKSQLTVSPEQQSLRQHYQNYARVLQQQQQVEQIRQQQQQSPFLQQQNSPSQYQQFQQIPFQLQQLQQRQHSFQQYYQPQGLQGFQQQIQYLQRQQQVDEQVRTQQPQQQQPLQQQRKAADPVASSVSFLGVKYSAAPSVAHTMFQTNDGVSISY